VALTDLGLELGLPPGLPKIRLRHLGAAIEATVLIDLSPAMRYPEPDSAGTDKTTFVREMTLALAEWLWAKGGMVRLGDLANPADLSEPMGAGSGHELDDHLRALFAAPRAGANPAGVDSAMVGSVCFALVSQTVDAVAVESVLRALTPDGVSVRILALRDPRELDCTGLTRNRSDGSWHDRTEWDAEDMSLGYRNRVVALERLSLAFDGRFVALDSDLNEGDITEALSRSNFLE